MKTLIALAAGLVVFSSLPVFGQTLNWDLGGSGGYASSNGNTLTFNRSGVSVTASAWSYTKGSGDTAFESAKLGQWGPGLGVVNREESNSSPWHQVDNYKQNDYVLFVFDRLVDVESVQINPSPGPYDRDVSYWTGNISNTNLDSVTYDGLLARGFNGQQVNTGSYGSSGRLVAINSPSPGVNAILFGPRQGVITDAHSYDLDAFKIKTISATISHDVIPEPSTAFLSLLGALGLCLRRRRR